MFTNPVFSAFFRQGQVLETFRGRGIYQPAVDSAIEKLNAGAWIHLFGEGKVNQPDDPHDPSSVSLLRFKWGCGRIVMEAAKPPIIIPMWLTGFHTLMPEGRSFPWKFLPRFGADLSVSFGAPIRTEELEEVLRASVEQSRATGTLAIAPGDHVRPLDVRDEVSGADTTKERWMGEVIADAVDKPHPEGDPQHEKADRIARVRSAVTALLHRYVEALGKEVTERQRPA